MRQPPQHRHPPPHGVRPRRQPLMRQRLPGREQSDRIPQHLAQLNSQIVGLPPRSGNHHHGPLLSNGRRHERPHRGGRDQHCRLAPDQPLHLLQSGIGTSHRNQASQRWTIGGHETDSSAQISVWNDQQSLMASPDTPRKRPQPTPPQTITLSPLAALTPADPHYAIPHPTNPCPTHDPNARNPTQWVSTQESPPSSPPQANQKSALGRSAPHESTPSRSALSESPPSGPHPVNRLSRNPHPAGPTKRIPTQHTNFRFVARPDLD